MHEETKRLPIPQRFKVARILAGSFIVSVLLYALLIYLIRSSSTTVMPPVDPVLRVVIYVGALSTMLCGRALLDKVFPLPAADGATDDTVGAALVTRLVILNACFESGAILGLLTFFMSHRITDFAILGGLTVLLQLANFPDRVEWENTARRFGLNWNLDQ